MLCRINIASCTGAVDAEYCRATVFALVTLQKNDGMTVRQAAFEWSHSCASIGISDIAAFMTLSCTRTWAPNRHTDDDNTQVCMMRHNDANALLDIWL